MPGANVNGASDAGGTTASARCFELFRRDVARLTCPGFSAVVPGVLQGASFDAPGTIFRNQPNYITTRTKDPSTPKARWRIPSQLCFGAVSKAVTLICGL